MPEDLRSSTLEQWPRFHSEGVHDYHAGPSRNRLGLCLSPRPGSSGNIR